MTGVQVAPISFSGMDERGKTTQIDNLDRRGPYILAYRNKGFWSGDHYHKGLSEFKAPEVVFLLSGQVKLEYGKVEDGRVLDFEIQVIESPSRIEISPNIWHKLNFMEDSCFFELNSFAEGDTDTFKLIQPGK